MTAKMIYLSARFISTSLLISNVYLITAQNLFGSISGGKIKVDGESTIHGQQNKIELQGYQLEIQKNSRGLENKQCTITKFSDASTAALLQMFENADVHNFNVEALNKDRKPVLSLLLEQAQIINIRQWFDETKQRPIEEIKLNYLKLKMYYKPKNQEVEITIGNIK